MTDLPAGVVTYFFTDVEASSAQTNDCVQDQDAAQRQPDERRMRSGEKPDAQDRSDDDADKQRSKSHAKLEAPRPRHELPGVRRQRRHDDQHRGFDRRHCQTEEAKRHGRQAHPEDAFDPSSDEQAHCDEHERQREHAGDSRFARR